MLNKAGIHFMNDENAQLWENAIIDLYKNYNITIPFVTVLNSYDRVQRLRQSIPNIFILYRVGGYGDTYDARNDNPQSYWDKHVPANLPSGMNALQIVNEPLVDPLFEIGLMNIAYSKGIKLAFGNWSVGSGPDPDHLPPSDDLFWAMLSVGQKQGHYLNYHSYSSEIKPYGDTTMMYAAYWTSLRFISWIKNYPGLQIILGEEGNFSALYLGEQSLNLIKEFNSMVCNNSQVLGFASWCGGFWDQKSSDLTGILPQWIDYIKSIHGTSYPITRTVNTLVLNLRSQPGTSNNAKIIGTYKKGTKLIVQSLVGQLVNGYHWLSVLDSKGKFLGYIAKELTI